MARKILKTLTNNIGFKLLAVLFALILWLIVYNIDDPTKTKTFTTTVSVVNDDVIKDLNKCYKVQEGNGSVTFTVTAKRSVLDKLSENDFVAVADMKENLVIDKDEKTASIKIDISCLEDADSIKVGGGDKYLKLDLENLVTKTFAVSAAHTGTPAESYAIGDVYVTSQEMIEVSGPASEVRKIAKVIATVDVEGMSQDFNDKVYPTLISEDGAIVDTTNLELSSTMVTVFVQVLKMKEVPIKLDTSGNPAAGSMVTGVSCSQETVTIIGKAEDVDNITEIKVPSSLLDVSGKDEDFSVSFEVSSYLPDNVRLLDGDELELEITVHIEKYESRSYTIPVGNISLKGLSEEYEALFPNGEITVAISASVKKLEELNVEDILGSIDLSGLKEGRHHVGIIWDLEQSVYKCGDVIVEIEIRKKPTEEPPQGN